MGYSNIIMKLTGCGKQQLSYKIMPLDSETVRTGERGQQIHLEGNNSNIQLIEREQQRSASLGFSV